MQWSGSKLSTQRTTRRLEWPNPCGRHCRRGLFFGYAALLILFFSPIPWIDAAKITCKQESKPLPLQYGKVMLAIHYEPEVIIVGGNFFLEVRIEYLPAAQIPERQFFQITAVQFDSSDLITLRRDLESKQGIEGEKWVTTHSYIFEINKDASPGNKEGLVVFQMGDWPPLRERFCVPVGSEGEEGKKYLTVEANPAVLTLSWEKSGEFALDLLNTYPYIYTITKIKSMPQPNAPYELKLPRIDPDNPIEVSTRNSDLRIAVTAKKSWTTLLAVSNDPIKAELRLTYKDPYERPVEEKAVAVNLIIVPPPWLLWLLAGLGGLVGGGLRYLVGHPDNPELKAWRELGGGAVVGLVVYALFQLGGISVLISKLNLTLDNNTGVVAVLLGLLGGWRGKGILERLV